MISALDRLHHAAHAAAERSAADENEEPGYHAQFLCLDDIPVPATLLAAIEDCYIGDHGHHGPHNVFVHLASRQAFCLDCNIGQPPTSPVPVPDNHCDTCLKPAGCFHRFHMAWGPLVIACDLCHNCGLELVGHVDPRVLTASPE